MTRIGEITATEPGQAWADLGPTRPSPSSGQRLQPSEKTLEVAGMIGLRYPPASSVDREAHAARVVLLAEDCADIDPQWLDAAARQWAKREPFFPRACELRAEALKLQRLNAPMRSLPSPLPARPVAPPLTDEEIAHLPPWLVKMGVKLGEIDEDRARRLRDDDPAATDKA